MHIFGENFSESEEAASHSKGKAYEPQLDANANLSLATAVNMDSRPKQGLVKFLKPTQTPCHLSRSFPGIRSETADEVHEPHLPRKPLLSMENDLSQGFTTETSEKATRREQQKCDRSSPEQSDETDEDNSSSNNLDLSYRGEELSEDYHSNVECGCQKGGVQSAGSVQRGELKSLEGNSEGEFSRANVDIPKKNFFHSLTRKPRWFRQDASKSAKKDKGQVLKAKSKSLKIPARHADENILISCPREDDFERMSSITKYLQTQEKLTKALVHISRLESQGQRDVETAPICDSNREFSNSQQQSSNESGKDWPKNEREVDTQDSQIPDKTLPFTPANTPEDQEAAGLPVPHDVGFRESSRAWQHQEPSENGYNDRRRDEISDGQRLSNNGPTGAARNANDTESVKPLGYSCQSDSRVLFRQYHDRDREPRHEEFKICPSCRSCFTEAFDEELSEREAKHKLKNAILEIDWSDDEWMELTEVVRRKRTEAGRVNVPYVNLPSSHERPAASSMDHTSAVGPSCPNSNGDMSRRVGMPPYENLKQDTSRTTTLPYQNITGDTCQASMYNDVQRLAIRAQGKPPIPAPRSQLSSI